MTEQHLRLGSVVIDRTRNVSLRVVGRDHRDAAEHPHVDPEDPMLRRLGVEPGDAVYDCVFLPDAQDDKLTAPRKTYHYPEGQLARVPVEAALEEDARRIHTQILVEFLAALKQAVHERDELKEAADQPTPLLLEDIVLATEPYIDAEVPTHKLLQEAQDLADAASLSGGETHG